MAYPQPVPLPPGAGCLVVTVNRGPYIVPAPSTTKLKIDGQQVAIAGPGTWYIPLPAGPHDVRYTDIFGIPMITTHGVTVQPGAACQLRFDFGVWRNRAYDGQGTDVTKFGLWSNYLIMLITIGVIGLVCCGGAGLLTALDS
ncbi:hypothetical protein [Micromonospora zhanjiangensis]